MDPIQEIPGFHSRWKTFLTIIHRKGLKHRLKNIVISWLELLNTMPHCIFSTTWSTSRSKGKTCHSYTSVGTWRSNYFICKESDPVGHGSDVSVDGDKVLLEVKKDTDQGWIKGRMRQVVINETVVKARCCYVQLSSVECNQTLSLLRG